MRKLNKPAAPKPAHTLTLRDVIGSPYTYLKKDLNVQPPIVLWCRVSAREQNRRGNLKQQVKEMNAWAQRKGFAVVSVLSEVRDGRDLNAGTEWDVAVADAIDARCPIVARSIDRFLRPQDFHTKHNPDAAYGQLDVAQLANGGPTLMTRIDPRYDWKMVRSIVTKLGQRAKGKFGGRPRATRSHQHLDNCTRQLIVRLRRSGRSYGAIAKIIRRPRSTVQSVCNRDM